MKLFSPSFAWSLTKSLSHTSTKRWLYPRQKTKSRNTKIKVARILRMIWNRWVSRYKERKHKADLHGLLFWKKHWLNCKDLCQWRRRWFYKCCDQIFSQYLTNLMQKFCFTVSFISYLYMFRAHVLIIRRSKLHYTASGIITPVAHVLETCRGMK